MDFQEAIFNMGDVDEVREQFLAMNVTEEAMVGNFGELSRFAFSGPNHARDCLVNAADAAWDKLDKENGIEGFKESLRGGVVIDRRALLALTLFATMQAERAVEGENWKNAVALVLASDEELLVKFIIASTTLAGESGNSLGDELFGGL
jgi:hypothetical protein